MTHAARPPSTTELAEAARTGLALPASADISITEVTHLGNLNYVYKVRAEGLTAYLKVVTETPKLLSVSLPKERIFFEAMAIARFGALCGPAVAVPEVLFVDRARHALGMSDVGRARRPLIELIDGDYALFVAQAVALGSALGRVHALSRGDAPFRPQASELMLHHVIAERLLAPGARAMFEDRWPAVAAELAAHRECLVHGDLWAKNLLVGPGVVPAIVDFEGAAIGDPGFDVATLLAVAVIPALKEPALLDSCIGFSADLVGAYRAAAGAVAAGDDWSGAACARAFLYAGTLLAARGFGPFPYPMSERARLRLARLARSLTLQPPADLAQYCARLSECLGIVKLAA